MKATLGLKVAILIAGGALAPVLAQARVPSSALLISIVTISVMRHDHRCREGR